MNIFDAVTVTGKVTQGTAASGAQDLIRLGEAQMLLATLFQGAWLAGTAYTAGQMVTADGALWLARANNTGLEPSGSPTQWLELMTSSAGAQGAQGSAGAQGALGAQGVAGAQGSQGAGSNGASAYVYVGYASDAIGTGFTTTFNGALAYIAVKATTAAISGPQASDFAGLWKCYQGAQGAQGSQGTQGTQGFQGAQGAQGSQGNIGLTGTTGAQGNQGSAGSNGAQGPQGTQGAGVQGAQGVQGAGAQGAQGAQGAGGSGGVAQVLPYTVSPTADGLTPANPALGALAYKFDGTGPLVGWNTVTRAWNA